MKKQKKPKVVECSHCKVGRTRQREGGIYFHTYKESNGMDYDRYTSLCAIQTDHGIELLRARALASLDKELAEAKVHVKDLKQSIKHIASATSVSAFRAYWE